MLTSEPVHAFSEPPDPGRARTLDELIQHLRLLKAWAEDLPYEVIKDRINTAWTKAGRQGNELTSKNAVAECFKFGRRRLSEDLLLAVVEALHPDGGYVSQWRQALRIVRGEATAASYVRPLDRLPDDVPGFVGRAPELDLLTRLYDGAGARVVVIDGMTGNGKTSLAIHAGHQLLRRHRFDVVLFVDLRGFDRDPAQLPAAPAAVLGEFLRQLGVPGGQVSSCLPTQLTRVYREQLEGGRSLIVLDNAADESQVLPLLPGCSGSLTLVTSRHVLVDLVVDVTRIHLGVFAQPEALALIRAAAGDERFDADPDAAVRIAKAHGFHPHSLGLTAGRIRTFPDWTLTDHLGRLIERIEPARLDGAVAVDDILDDRVRRAHQLRFENDVRDNIRLSYDGLGPGARLVLRRLVLHPGDDMDVYAAAALTADDLDATQTYIDELLGANLLHQRTPGRYGQHDLVHRFAYSTPTTRTATATAATPSAGYSIIIYTVRTPPNRFSAHTAARSTWHRP